MRGQPRNLHSFAAQLFMSSHVEENMRKTTLKVVSFQLYRAYNFMNAFNVLFVLFEHRKLVDFRDSDIL